MPKIYICHPKMGNCKCTDNSYTNLDVSLGKKDAPFYVYTQLFLLIIILFQFFRNWVK